MSKLPSQTEERRDKDAEKEETTERKEPLAEKDRKEQKEEKERKEQREEKERKEPGAAAKGNKKIQSKIDNRRNKKVNTIVFF